MVQRRSGGDEQSAENCRLGGKVFMTSILSGSCWCLACGCHLSKRSRVGKTGCVVLRRYARAADTTRLFNLLLEMISQMHKEGPYTTIPSASESLGRTAARLPHFSKSHPEKS